MVSQLTRADLPIPRPEDVAILKVSKSTLPPFCLMCTVKACNTSRCHLRGPLKCSKGVPFCPHGNVNSTNANGSSLIVGDQSLLINCISSCAEYCVVCIYCQPLLSLLESSEDTNLLRNIDLHLLLGDPLMLVLKYL